MKNSCSIQVNFAKQFFRSGMWLSCLSHSPCPYFPRLVMFSLLHVIWTAAIGVFLAIRGKEITYGENSSSSSFLESLSRKSVCWAPSKCRFLLRIGKGSWRWEERWVRNIKLLLLINSTFCTRFHSIALNRTEPLQPKYVLQSTDERAIFTSVSYSG